MSTPVAERVRQCRQRQRQAHPRQPFWPDLEGKLNTAAIWLDLGNPAPTSFVDTVLTVAEKLGFDVRKQLPCRGYGVQPDADNEMPPDSAT